MANLDRTKAELLRDLAKIKKQQLTPEQFRLWFDGVVFAAQAELSLGDEDVWNEQSKIREELEETA